jgi:hypothetical protein
MSLNPNATATINIRGLAVCREVQNKWDVIFLHPKEKQEGDVRVTHKLTISIIERNKFNPNGVLKYSKTLNIGSKIEIEAETPISTSDIYEPDNWLVEKGSVWMINLDRFHSPQGVKLKSNANVFQSYLSISNAIFYAEERTPNLYKIIEVDSGSQLQKRRIGYLAGADIQCSVGGKIIINGIPNSPSLPSINGVKYEIILDNSCDSQDCNGKEDFHHYYNNLDWTGSKIDIEKTPESGKGNALLMSDEAACNPIIGGNGSDISFLEFYEKNLPKS